MDRAAFYKKKSWKEIRESVLRRAGYMDELELRAGRRTEANTVHHIFPLEKYPEYGLEKWNLISISNDTHELLHNRATGDLSPLGWDLLWEVAEKRNISVSRTILVCGFPGSGKTKFVKRHMKHGLVYNLDYIAAAFRLKRPGEEVNEPSRKMANSMVRAFAQNAGSYSGLVWIIRTAPTIEEIADIRPDSVVIMEGNEPPRTKKNIIYKERLNEIKDYCENCGVELTIINR